MNKSFFVTGFFILSAFFVQSQELQARITVLSDKISSQVDKKVFQTLQAALNNFINNRKWTSDNFQTSEKINCSFLINLDKDLGNNSYEATLTIQAARPVYNTTYDSPLINSQDPDFTFRFVEFQPIHF